MTAPKLEEEISKNSNGVHEVVFNFKQEKISFEDNGIKFNPLEKKILIQILKQKICKQVDQEYTLSKKVWIILNTNMKTIKKF